MYSCSGSGPKIGDGERPGDVGLADAKRLGEEVANGEREG
jgi:hypothetical protein